MRAIRKRVEGNNREWDLYVPAVQLAMNAKVSKRLDTAPYSLMFARKLNDFKDYRNEDKHSPMNREDLLKRIDHMSEVVFPAIEERTEAVTGKQKSRFDERHKLVEFPTNSYVMKRVLQKKNKLHPEYEGPFIVVRKTKGGSYILKDETGDLLTNDIPPSQLKLISQDEIVSTDKAYEVERIIAHNADVDGELLYKIRWKGYSPKDDTWEPYENLNCHERIHEYWERINEVSPHISGLQKRKRRQPTRAPSTRKSQRIKK
jgi:hypothetical protein